MRNPLASGVEMAVLRRRHRRGTFRSTNRQETRNFRFETDSSLFFLSLDYLNNFFFSRGLETQTHTHTTHARKKGNKVRTLVGARRMDGWMDADNDCDEMFSDVQRCFFWGVFSSCTRTITNSLTGLYILRLAIN